MMPNILRFLVLLLCFGSLLLSAQNPVTISNRQIARVLYKDGTLHQALPYGQRFIIHGSTLQPGTFMSTKGPRRANVVKLEIYAESDPLKRWRRERWSIGRKSRKQRPITFESQPRITNYWWYQGETGADRSSEEFELFVPTALYIDTYYLIRISFYHRFTANDQTTQVIVREVTKRLIPSDQNLTEIKVADVRTTLEEVVGEYQKQAGFGQFSFSEQNQLLFDPNRPITFAVPPLDSQLLAGTPQRSLARVLLMESQLNTMRKEVDGYQAEVNSLVNTPVFTSLLSQLQADLDDPAISTPYTAASLSLLTAFARTFQAQKGEDVLDRLASYVTLNRARYNTTPIGLNELKVMVGLAEVYFDMADRLDAIHQMEAQLVVLSKEVDASILEKVITETFVQSQVAELIETPFTISDSAWEKISATTNSTSNRRTSFTITPENESSLTKTSYDAIQIGTAGGIGLVGMNFPTLRSGQSLSQTQYNMNAYIGVKLYFHRVDKRLLIENPYPLFTDRFSLLAGLQISTNLDYQGRSYLGVFSDNTNAIKPILGLSFDFTRSISLDLGAVMFREEALSPFQQTKLLRAAPFIGLSIDANVFNAARTAIKGFAGQSSFGGAIY